MSTTSRLLLPTVGLLLGLAACGEKPAPPPAPATPVETLRIEQRDTPHVVELPGRIGAVRIAEVRARVDGIVKQRLFDEGSLVKAGDPLFQIEQRDYLAQVQAAEAGLQRAQATRENAASIVARYKPLLDEQAVSDQEFVSSESELRQAEAQVSEARAALVRAKLLLEYTTVRAPIAGKVGRAEVTEGALVSSGQATLMAQVNQVSPVHAAFSESNAALLDTVEQIRSGTLSQPEALRYEVTLMLENGTEYVQKGVLDFASPVVDPLTGSQSLRAVFDNPDGLLAPGQFVRGRIEAGTLAHGIVVPARAVQFKGQEASVMLLADDGTVAARPIVLGAMLGKDWVVQSGLKGGEQLIVEGWQKLRPGQKAQATPAATSNES